MSDVVVVADLLAAPGTGDALVEAFAEAIARTHEEEGCLLYALHRDQADPDHFVHLEQYRSQADLDSHMAQPYTKAVFAWAGTPGNLGRAPQLTFLQGLGIGAPDKGSLQGARA
jgi:quinol monooxygenase YgiN